MKVKYCCSADKPSLDQYYANQAGGYMPVYAGARMQRGHGLGSIFSAIGRFALPILRRIAPVVGRKIMKTGAQIMGDVAAGQAFKHAAKTRIVDTINEGIDKILPPQEEQGQSGSGKRRRRTKTRSSSNSNKRKKRRVAAKIVGRDIFT
jgi:hypothetical protein